MSEVPAQGCLVAILDANSPKLPQVCHLHGCRSITIELDALAEPGAFGFLSPLLVLLSHVFRQVCYDLMNQGVGHYMEELDGEPFTLL